jgi:hypothetical protein
MNFLDELERTRKEVDNYYLLPDEQMDRTYQQDKWTVREILVHLADAETVLQERIKRVLAEPGKMIWAFDQDRWSTSLDYPHYPLDICRAMFNANRRSIIYLAGKYYQSHGQLRFEHSETGTRTLKDEFEKVLYHCENHIIQIRTAIGR